MARVVISYVFADGDQMQVSVSGKVSYPDALDEMRVEAIKGFTEAMRTTRVVQVEEES